ncbi:MAG: YibE/F family protein [Clostridia bacterium]|nr:YibE/F family protein [Clostridia bacterium]
MKKKIIYPASVALAVILLVLGYLAVRDGYDIEYGDAVGEYLRTKITKITKVDEYKPYDESTYTVTTYYFDAEVKSGERAGDIIHATQVIDSSAMYNSNPVSEGDKVILCQSKKGDESSWAFAEFIRSDAIIVLGVLFCIAIIAFGRLKGLKTLITLILTIGSVFFVLIPAILSGRNIYFWTIVVCLYITVMTLVIVNGISYMSLVGMLGCMGGVLISAAITLVMDLFLKLTGYTDECTIYIKGINNGAINLKALVFAGILIGSIGAVMDVAVNIAASVHEVATKVEKPSFRELYKSGLTISRDIIGTMSNTLILAYIGSSLCSVLLIIYSNSFSMLNLFNRENLIVELLKILVGSFGILSALPITSAIAALFYSKLERFSAPGRDNAESDQDDYSQMLEEFNENEK